VISVVMLTKWRDEQAVEIIKGLAELSENPNDTEIVVSVDKDDEEAAGSIGVYGRLPLVSYVLGRSNAKGYLGIGEYTTDACRLSRGEWIFIINDDSFVKTKGWDAIIRSEGDGNEQIKILQCQSNIGKNNFPVISRRLFDILGHVSPHPQLDTWLQSIGVHLNIMKDIGINILHHKGNYTKEEVDRLQERNESVFNAHLHNSSSEWHFRQQKWQDLIFEDIYKVKIELDKNEPPS